MGASNVAAVYTHWRKLPDRAFRLLTYMALVSMDRDMPPRYFGGVDPLVEALGRDLPATHADRVAVSGALTQLARVGAVSRATTPARGRRAEYALHLTHQAQPDEQARLILTTHQADADTCQAQPGPKEEQEPLGTLEETRSPEVSTSPAVDAGIDDASCPRCKWLPQYGHATGCAEAS